MCAAPRLARLCQALGLAGVLLVGCSKKDRGAPSGAASAVVSPPGPPCPGGQSLDPTSAELRPAVTAFKDGQYESAQKLLDALIQKYPNSATARVWRGDAALFDKRAEYKAAADAALTYYRQATSLREQGCGLPEAEDYYLRFDAALASLRKGDADAAIAELARSHERWPDSAEVSYNLARAHCMKNDVDACFQRFEQALETAKSLKRPKFLRSHYSLDDWARRSKTQSELAPLRRDKRYAKLIASMKE